MIWQTRSFQSNNNEGIDDKSSNDVNNEINSSSMPVAPWSISHILPQLIPH